MTVRENTQRGKNGYAMKTHCPRGHPYAGENLHIRADGARQCRACRRDWMRRKRASLRQEWLSRSGAA